MEIREVDVSEVFDDKSFQAAVQEYAAEAATAAIGRPQPSREGYEALQRSGLFKASAAYEGSDLVGFVSVIGSEMPHYGHVVAAIDTIWLHRDHRKGAAGLRLIREAKRLAGTIGATSLFGSAPVGSRLSKVFNLIGHKTDEVFYLE